MRDGRVGCAWPGRLVRTFVVLLVAWVCVLAGQVSAQEMPDPKQMSGIPRPVTDLPSGSLSVRLIKGDLSNNIAGHPVELHVGDTVQTVKTDGAGRAQFDKLPSGATLKAVAVVDGERLESQEFPAPVQGGIRLMLVATDKEKEQRAALEAKAPAISGQVVIGGESRIVIEPGEESVSVYYIFEILNNARAPVNPPTPFAFDLPSGMVGTGIMQGSTPRATASGVHVKVDGPFPSGKTIVEVGGSLPVTSGTLQFQQTFPAIYEQPVLIAKKEGALKVFSPQFDRMQESVVDGGTAVIVGAGSALAAGQPVSITLSGLAHHSDVPGTVALSLALGIAVLGAIAALRPGDPKERSNERKRLTTRREKLLQDLVRVEQEHRRGRLEEGAYSARREDLVSSLEHVYAALDVDESGADLMPRPGLSETAGQRGASS